MKIQMVSLTSYKDPCRASLKGRLILNSDEDMSKGYEYKGKGKRKMRVVR